MPGRQTIDCQGNLQLTVDEIGDCAGSANAGDPLVERYHPVGVNNRMHRPYDSDPCCGNLPMDALTLLTTRASQPLLTEPAPDAAAMATLLAAAARAPDHARLRPWRFIRLSGDARVRLGELFLQTLLQRDPQASPEKRDKALKAPLRAPLVIVAVARLQPHPKVPASEQLLTAGCATHALLLAAQALNYGAIWRTGDPSYDPAVAQALGLEVNENIIGFIYLGTPTTLKSPPPLDTAGMVSDWP